MIGKTNALVGGGGPSPSGTIQISSNGIYDVGSYASASVSVPQTSTEPTAVELVNGTISYFSDSTIMSLRSYMFYNCTSLSQCILNSSAYYIESYTFYRCFNLLDLSCLSTGGLTDVGSYAFAWCTNLSTNVSVRSNYNFNIGAYAFANCSNITTVSLYTSAVGNNMVSLSAFCNCSNLSSIYISTSFIGDLQGAFIGTAIPFIDDSINFNPAKNYPASYVIPSMCFASCSQISYVKLQSSQYRIIGMSAFMYNNALRSVYGSNVTNIHNSAFNNCANLVQATFPVATNIGSLTFNNCSSLLSFSCSTLTYMGGSAFYNCGGLKYINTPKVSICYSRTFNGCSNLLYVNCRSVFSINSTAFAGCSALKSYMVVTSSQFRLIGSYNFQQCFYLESFYLFTTSTIAMSNIAAFGMTPLSNSTYLGYYGSIYVRQSLLSSYQTVTNWAAYSDRMVGLTDEQVSAIISAYDAVTYEDVVGE